MNVLSMIKRKQNLFAGDIDNSKKKLNELFHKSKILVVGGAGTIGKATTIEIFKRSPDLLHIVDISENNMVELVRDIRSSVGYIKGDFRTFALDVDSIEFDAFINNDIQYDYIFNLSALKHVRSEKDPFSLMRMVNVNIFNSVKLLEIAKKMNAKYFCVSTDKASNPVNMMGASKLIMEMFLAKSSSNSNISMARFANVAFSDGSLLHGFNQRFIKKQPISAPRDIKRYFMTPQESGQLCLLSGFLGDQGEIFFPKSSDELSLTTFSDIAKNFIISLNYEPYECETEDEARMKSEELIKKYKWPCYFFDSNTTGEKQFEEFHTNHENIDLQRFKSIGIISKKINIENDNLRQFSNGIKMLKERGSWTKDEILDLFYIVLPDFSHIRTGKNLDQRM